MIRPVPEPRFRVGDKFLTAGKHKKLCMVTDILRTYNLDGELVAVQYVAEHEFCGQKITEAIPDATVARGICELQGISRIEDAK